MKVVIAGGSGFLGSALTQQLRARGDQVVVLSRARARRREDAARTVTSWTPDGSIGPWAGELDGADAVVNLAGEPLAGRRWTAAHKARILESRVLATRSLVEAVQSARHKPAVLISGSGVGFYPDSDEVVDETSPAGIGFLSRVCVAWEAEASRAEGAGCRVVLMRTGVVLHRDGGAIQKLLFPFSLGLGGPVGSGSQWWAWIHRDDWVRMALWSIDTPELRGPINVCAPEPARNREIMRALGRALRRPSLIPAPAPALKVLFGDMARAMLLASQRAVPRAARDGGFEWTFPQLQTAMNDAVRASPGR